MNAVEFPILMSPKIAAQALGVSRPTVLRYMDHGHLENIEPVFGHRRLETMYVLKALEIDHTDHLKRLRALPNRLPLRDASREVHLHRRILEHLGLVADDGTVRTWDLFELAGIADLVEVIA